MSVGCTGPPYFHSAAKDGFLSILWPQWHTRRMESSDKGLLLHVALFPVESELQPK